MQHNRKGYFVALEGIDGSGKTTLSQEVANRLRYHNASYCSKKEIARNNPYVEKCMLDIAAIMWPKENIPTDHLLPPQYWLHMQACWYTLLSEFVVSPKLEEDGALIADGWYYKIMVKLLRRGFERNYLDEVFSHIIQPDMVILLEPTLEDIWNRREFRWHEMGSHHDYAELGKSSFIDHQSKILNYFKALAQEMNWIVMPLDASASIEHNAEIIQFLIEEHLHLSRHK